MKTFRKVIYSLFIIAVIAVSSVVIASIIYKDKIIDLLIIEVNKNIKTELEVEKIDLKLLKNFPNISVDFKGVKFHSAFTNEVLLESKNVYFALNAFDLFNNSIVIEKLEIIDADITLHVNKVGQRNFDVLVSQKSSTPEEKSLNLKSILLKNVTVITKLDNKQVRVKSHINSFTGGVFVQKGLLEMKVQSELVILKTNLKPIEWVLGKQVKLSSNNIFEDNSINITNSIISIEEMLLQLNGVVGIKDNEKIDLSLSAAHLNLKDLRSVLPEKVKKKLLGYRTSGDVGINARLKGGFDKGDEVGLKAEIQLTNLQLNNNTFLHPIKQLNGVGELEITNLNKLSSGRFKFSHLEGVINTKKLVATVNVLNFKDPEISGKVEGELDVPWVLNLKKYRFNHVKGTIGVDISGDISLNNSFKLISNNLQGSLVFDTVKIDSVYGTTFSLLKGEAKFENQQIKLKDIHTSVGSNSMIINGRVALPNENNNRVYAEFEGDSEHLNLDEIFGAIKNIQEGSAGNGNAKKAYSASINLSIKSLQFLKFTGKNLHLNLGLDENRIKVSSASASAFGGRVEFSGVGSKQFNGDYFIRAHSKTNQIFIDSLFYVFGNFNQSFITSEALKGKLDADIEANMYFDKNWNLRRNLLYSEAFLRVKEGELKNYEPVMSLSSHLNEEDENLSQLKFSNLENHIIISDDTVFISEMYVGTNVRNIKIGGYHTLNQEIDYRLAVPVINSKKDSDSQFGKVKKNDKGELFFPFRVYGTTTDYKVVYDFKTAGSNFFKGLKKEIKSVTQRLENVKDSLKLEEDEYFDWDNN